MTTESLYVACPHCEKQSPVSEKVCVQCGAKQKRKGSVFRWIGLALLGVYGLSLIGRFADPDIKSESATVADTASGPESARKNVGLDFTWDKSGFGSFMEADFIVENKNSFPIKDIVIQCRSFGKSHTEIDKNTETICDFVPGNSKKTFFKVNMGFIRSQVESTSFLVV